MASELAEPGTGPGLTQASPTIEAASGKATASSSVDRVTAAPFPALTKEWSRPQSCTWTYVVSDPGESASPGATAWLDLEPIPGASTLSCYPPGMYENGHTGIFSPGTCPGGWTTATLTSSMHTTLGAMVTTAICCSEGYTLAHEHCKRAAPTALAVPILYNGTYEVLTQSTTTLYSAKLAVNTIQVMYTDQEKSKLGIDTTQRTGKGSLSKEDCIGIAVGVAVFILLCAGAIYFILARRRRSREGLTEERLIRDLKSMRRDSHGGIQGSSYHSPEMMSAATSPLESPPPAYGCARSANSRSESSIDSRGRRQRGARDTV